MGNFCPPVSGYIPDPDPDSQNYPKPGVNTLGWSRPRGVSKLSETMDFVEDVFSLEGFWGVETDPKQINQKGEKWNRTI